MKEASTMYLVGNPIDFFHREHLMSLTLEI